MRINALNKIIINTNVIIPTAGNAKAAEALVDVDVAGTADAMDTNVAVPNTDK